MNKEQIGDLFEFDPLVGFTNRISRGRACAGCRAGYIDVHGYRRIVIDYQKYYEHHLVWFYVYGEWPDEIDHKNRIRSDNAVANLRKATRTQNNFNAKRETGMSGLKGAYWDSRVSKWYSKIQVGGQVKWLGSLNTAEEAHKACMVAVEHHHGEFAFHNRPSSIERRI